MDQSEFSVAGATGNSNAFVTVKSAVPFFSFSPPVSSCVFLLAPVSLRYEYTISTNQKGTACSLYVNGLDRMETGYESTEHWVGIDLKSGYESTEKETSGSSWVRHNRTSQSTPAILEFRIDQRINRPYSKLTFYFYIPLLVFI